MNSGILGPDGRPLTPEGAAKMSQQGAQDAAFKRAEIKQFVLQWERFYTAETVEDAKETRHAEEMTRGGFPEEAVEKLYEASKMANEMLVKFPNKDMFMVQVCEYLVAITSGHPDVLNQPPFVATMCATLTGIVQERPRGHKEKEDE